MRPRSSGLKMVATRHLDRISRMMCSKTDKFVDISHEVQFFAELGLHNYLKDNKKVLELLQRRAVKDIPIPAGMVEQEVHGRFDLMILGHIVAAYDKEGMLNEVATPEDTEDEAPHGR